MALSSYIYIKQLQITWRSKGKHFENLKFWSCWCYHSWDFFLVNCNQLESCKGLCLDLLPKVLA